jgi:antitoxin component of MazEF toxin-antitoxin module
MTDQDPEQTSQVELSVGQTSIRIEGTESFIERELPTLLDWVDTKETEAEQHEQVQTEDNTDEADVQSSLPVKKGTGAGNESGEAKSKLDQVAQQIGADADKLSDHFYIDESEETIHIQNPMDIDSKYALLGYCDIREKLTGETYHDNSKTKKKLIDQEKVDIERWGSSLLYTLRRNGLIKDDPNSDRNRNKPFKITPKGHKKFVKWINGDA